MIRVKKIKTIMAALCAVFVMAMMTFAPVHAETHTPGIHQGNVQNTASGTIRTSKGRTAGEPRKASASAASRTDSRAVDDKIIRMGAVFIVAICVFSTVFSVLRGGDIRLGPILFLLLVAGGAMLSLSW